LVSTGRPEDTGGYDSYEVDGIKVFVQKGIVTVDGVLKFRLRKFLFLTEIEAVGVKVI
jgi:hypothetical protein